MKPKMFIGSSKEKLDLAYAAQENLEHDVESTVWTQGVFQLSKTSVASLIRVLNQSDFGLFILSPDDISSIRNKSVSTVRDNVIFELGLFAGKFGIERCFMIVPNGVDDLHLPTDLLGLTPATYDPNRQDNNPQAALGPACNKVRKAVAEIGATAPMAKSAEPPQAPEEFCSDQNDCIVLLQSWIGNRTRDQNQSAIRFTDVDKALKLAPGSAAKFIEQAASRYNLVASNKGKDFIIFEDGPPVGPFYA
jgi:hypothetical protein